MGRNEHMWGDVEQRDRDQGASWQDYSLAPHGSFTPPRLQAIRTSESSHNSHAYDGVFDPGATQPLPNLTIAELRFSAETVRRRAAAFAEQARSSGMTHSMRLWKAGYEEAFLSLVRETLAAPRGASYELLSWRKDGEHYLVSVTFDDAGDASISHAYH